MILLKVFIVLCLVLNWNLQEKPVNSQTLFNLENIVEFKNTQVFPSISDLHEQIHILAGWCSALESCFSLWWDFGQQQPWSRWLAEVTEASDWHTAHRHLPSCSVPPRVTESEASALAASSGSFSGAAASHQQRVRRWWCHEGGRSEPQQRGQTPRRTAECYSLKNRNKGI